MIKLIALLLILSTSSTFKVYPKISLRYSDRKFASLINSECEEG